MTKKTKWILIIVGTALLLAGLVIFGVTEVVPTSDEDVTPDTTQVDSVAMPMVDSLVEDTVAVAE